MRAAILTISTTRASERGGTDESGDELAAIASELGAEIAARAVVSDEREEIAAQLRDFCEDGCDLVLTTGGTGVAPRDVTPEATRSVIEREVPGIAEAMRDASRPHTRHWMLSRGVAGIRGGTLIINFPGNPRSIRQTAGSISEALPHALALIANDPTTHA